MDAQHAHELEETAELLCQLADVVEESQLSAADIGAILLDSLRASPHEPSADVRFDILQLANSDADTHTFVAGLRYQADRLRRMAVTAGQVRESVPEE